ncbi:hypothetical protein N431DRAFT_433986 [Stipitochalara longipes BDJ]|nr:hypothetical protein N431DRAFT_433986 [Stipitochalara longipes BDJ]
MTALPIPRVGLCHSLPTVQARPSTSTSTPYPFHHSSLSYRILLGNSIPLNAKNPQPQPYAFLEYGASFQV